MLNPHRRNTATPPCRRREPRRRTHLVAQRRQATQRTTQLARPRGREWAGVVGSQVLLGPASRRAAGCGRSPVGRAEARQPWSPLAPSCLSPLARAGSAPLPFPSEYLGVGGGPPPVLATPPPVRARRLQARASPSPGGSAPGPPAKRLIAVSLHSLLAFLPLGLTNWRC